MELTLLSCFPNDSIKTWSSLSRVWCDREKRRQIPQESRDVCGTNRSIRSVVDALVKRRFFSRAAGYLCELSDSTMVGCEDTAVTKRANFSPPICSIYLVFPVVSCQRSLASSFVALSHFAAEIRSIALVDFSISRRADIITKCGNACPAGNNWWYAPDDTTRPASRNETTRETEKHPVAIYYRRLSIIDAASRLKRDSAVVRFFTAYWLVERFILWEIFDVPVELLNNNSCLRMSLFLVY